MPVIIVSVGRTEKPAHIGHTKLEAQLVELFRRVAARKMDQQSEPSVQKKRIVRTFDLAP